MHENSNSTTTSDWVTAGRSARSRGATGSAVIPGRAGVRLLVAVLIALCVGAAWLLFAPSAQATGLPEVVDVRIGASTGDLCVGDGVMFPTEIDIDHDVDIARVTWWYKIGDFTGFTNIYNVSPGTVSWDVSFRGDDERGDWEITEILVQDVNGLTATIGPDVDLTSTIPGDTVYAVPATTQVPSNDTFGQPRNPDDPMFPITTFEFLDGSIDVCGGDTGPWRCDAELSWRHQRFAVVQVRGPTRRRRSSRLIGRERCCLSGIVSGLADRNCLCCVDRPRRAA